MNKQNLALGLAVIAIVVGAFVYFNVPKPTPKPPLGSAAGNTFNFPCVNFNGVEKCTYKYSLAQATSTACRIVNGPATSTVSFFSIQGTVATTTVPIIISVGTSTASNTYATTSPIARKAVIAASNQFFLSSIATSSATTGGTAGDVSSAQTPWLSPGGALVFGLAGGSAGGQYPTGTCSAELITQ